MGIRILVPRPRRPEGMARTHKFLWAAFAVALWGVAYALFGSSGMVGVYRARADVTALELEVARAEATNRELERSIAALRSDPDTIERYARQSFFMARPGETLYLLPPVDSPAPGSSSSAAPPGGPH